MTNLREDISSDGLKVGMNDKSFSQVPRPSKRIIQKYHKFDNFLGWNPNNYIISVVFV